MKKTFAALALALAVAMPLAGCSGNDTAGGEDKTGSMTTFPPGGGISSGVTNGDASRATDYGYGYAHSSTRNPGTDDLAGADGLVGGSGGNNTGANSTSGDNGTGMSTGHGGGTAGMSTGSYGHGDAEIGGGLATGRNGGAATHDPIARMGRGIENTLDDMGDAARDMGQDARQMLR